MMKEKDLVEAYQELESMIQLTSDLFDELVDIQGERIKLHYPDQVICISLVRLKSPDNRCSGVCWKKFSVNKDGFLGRKYWRLEHTPACYLTRRMEESDKIKFRSLHKYAKSIKSMREDLINKKMRILCTAREVKAFKKREMQRLEEKYGQFLRRTSRKHQERVQ